MGVQPNDHEVGSEGTHSANVPERLLLGKGLGLRASRILGLQTLGLSVSEASMVQVYGCRASPLGPRVTAGQLKVARNPCCNLKKKSFRVLGFRVLGFRV